MERNNTLPEKISSSPFCFSNTRTPSFENSKVFFSPRKIFYFFENAKVKAQSLYDLIKSPVISEDSGLLVQYLDDKPGVHSSRIASTDKKRNSIILEKLANVDYENRDASFLSCFCYLDEHANPIFFYGKVSGKIHSCELGKNGFGYDPIFYIPKLKKTFGPNDSR